MQLMQPPLGVHGGVPVPPGGIGDVIDGAGEQQQDEEEELSLVELCMLKL